VTGGEQESRRECVRCGRAGQPSSGGRLASVRPMLGQRPCRRPKQAPGGCRRLRALGECLCGRPWNDVAGGRRWGAGGLLAGHRRALRSGAGGRAEAVCGAALSRLMQSSAPAAATGPRQQHGGARATLQEARSEGQPTPAQWANAAGYQSCLCASSAHTLTSPNVSTGPSGRLEWSSSLAVAERPLASDLLQTCCTVAAHLLHSCREVARRRTFGGPDPRLAARHSLA